MPITVDEFAGEVAGSGVVAAGELQQFMDGLPPDEQPSDGEHLGRLLVRHKKLTAYQAQAIYHGDGKNLVLGNYVILSKLGEGGMGLVFRALHSRMRRQVALKVIAAGAMKSEEAVKRFKREVEAVARLNHPHIVTAYDADDCQGTHFLVMEYVEGCDLGTLLQDSGWLPVEQVLGLILQAARGLEFAHQQGVVHRDIKPANLLLDTKGTVKILDMGLARILSAAGSERTDLTGSGQIMGTADFMAPEQALNTKKADHRADIYSLGLTLWYLVTGKTAYQGETAIEVLMAHQLKPVPSLREACPAVSPELDAVFHRMVAKDAADRYQNMGEVIAALQNCGHSITPPPSVVVAGSGDSQWDGTFVGEAGISRAGKPSAALAGTEVLRGGARVLRGDTEAVTTVLQRTSQDGATAGQGAESGTKARRAWWKDRRVLVATGGGLALLAALLVFAIPTWGTPELENKGSSTRTGTRPPPLGNSEPPRQAVVPFDAAWALYYQESWAKHLGIKVEVTSTSGIKLRLIPPCAFMMGTPQSELEQLLGSTTDLDWQSILRSEAPTHQVALSKACYLSVYEVTQEEYEALVGSNPSAYSATGTSKNDVEGLETRRHPVEKVSWFDAIEFCNKLSKKDGVPPYYDRSGNNVTILGGTGYRLPTEAEWEYACRAGTESRWHYGEAPQELPQYGWFVANSENRTHEVGKLKPNAYGLYDMHGNVYEWCWDVFETEYYGSTKGALFKDPLGPDQERHVSVIRGGSFGFSSTHARSAARGRLLSTIPSARMGIRVARNAQ